MTQMRGPKLTAPPRRVGTIASDDLEASDHCAISVDFDL